MSQQALEIKDLLHIYSHFQTDIENVKQRQWRDFNATLAGQGGVLFLFDHFQDDRILFAILSFFLWAAGMWFLIEDREVLAIYRTGKIACLDELKKYEDISKIIDPPGIPEISGKYHHCILSAALLITTAVVIYLLLECYSVTLVGPQALWGLPICIMLMLGIRSVLEYAVPQLAKKKVTSLALRD